MLPILINVKSVVTEDIVPGLLDPSFSPYLIELTLLHDERAFGYEALYL